MKSVLIERFLKENSPKDLADLYSIEMECQVNVAQDGGTRVEGEYKGKQWHGWTDGLQTWKSFRIPLNAKTDPTYEDSPIKWDFKAHVEGIGMTGWNWKTRTSHWVAYDFDSIVGHSERHTKKLTDIELREILQITSNIEWITVRKSTSGKGLHLYVFVDYVPTQNHNEHAALARAILSQLSGIVGFNFGNKVDVCGGNMWVWHRKMKGTDGLTLIKKGTILKDIPGNWRDHIGVVTNKSFKATPENLSDKESFEELTCQRNNIPLDDEHKKLISYLDSQNLRWWWNADYHMLITHTAHLAQAHAALNLKGIYKTASRGLDKGDINCFSGNTEVITPEGPKILRELSGKLVKLYVKTDKGMEWVESPVVSFGKQKVYPMFFGDGSIVWSTYNHQWIEKKSGGKIPTHEIHPGKTELPLANRDLPEIDYEGYAHGFVFGDGWVNNTRGKRTCQVSLFKNDNDLLKLLLKYGNYGTNWYPGHGHVNCVRQLPLHWKELPSNPSREYALGFILGFISADGFVNDHLQINQSNYSVLEEVRKLAIYCGLHAYVVREASVGNFKNSKQAYKLSISSYNVDRSMFLRKDQQSKFIKRRKHSATTVSHIGWDSGIEEEVFCAIVPKWHNFTLANHVITGNCFAFPLRNGAWVLRRYSKGCSEDPSWFDRQGWTQCYFNKEPDLATAASINEGIEMPGGGFHFKYAVHAQNCLKLLGVELSLEEWAKMRKTKIKQQKDNRLLVEIEHEDADPNFQGWFLDKKSWKRLFSISNQSVFEPEIRNYDDMVRHLVSSGDEDYGWAICSDGHWREEPLAHVKVALESLGMKANEVKNILGACVLKSWKVVNMPFKEEYPGDRRWNRCGVRFRHTLSLNENLTFPHWMRILEHLGRNLDPFMTTDWCKQNGILKGSDYLQCWISSLFKNPEEPLPYLFFFGEQNTGKSILHEAISLLITNGVIRADHALNSGGSFNAELENAILCVIEETDLQKNKTAYNRIKDWVTARHLSIHKKGSTPYLVPNTTHYIQCGNDLKNCPVFPGDSRITVIRVDPIRELIPKRDLITLLEKEASDFLTHIMNLELPPITDRLAIPIINTDDKLQAQETNKSPLEVFIDEECYFIPGSVVTFAEFYDKFTDWNGSNNIAEWSKIRVSKELPQRFPTGRLSSTSTKHIGNISFNQATQPQEELIAYNGKLTPKPGNNPDPKPIEPVHSNEQTSIPSSSDNG